MPAGPVVPSAGQAERSAACGYGLPDFSVIHRLIRNLIEENPQSLDA